MLYAVKGNKSYQIGDNASLRSEYLNRGYDIVDEKGRTVQHSPAKTVPYAKYAALLAENEALKRQLAEITPEIPAEPPVDEPDDKPRGRKS